MTTDANFALDILCLFVLLILFVSTRIEEKNLQSAILFRSLITCAFLFVTLDVLMSYADENWSDAVADILYLSEVVAEFACYLIFSMYYFNLTEGPHSIRNKRFAALIVLGLAAVMVLLISSVNGVSYGEVSRGGVLMTMLVIALCACPMILVAVDSILRIGRTPYPDDRKEIITFTILALVPLLTSMMFTYIYPTITVECAGVTACILSLTICRVNRSIIIDPYSGFRLRFLLTVDLEQVFEKNRDTNGTVVAVADVDRFKYIVETFGHGDGMTPLIELSKAIKVATDGLHCKAYSSTSSSDEIFIIMDGGTREQMEAVRSKVYSILEERSRDLPYELHVSIGIAVQSPDVEKPRELFELADKDMYAQKEAFYAQRGYTRRT